MVSGRTLFPLVLLLMSGGIVSAGTVTIAPSKDNTLFQDSTGSLSNGSGQYLFVGRTAQSDSLSRRRALLQFDIAGNIPDGSTITQVSLTLHMSRTAGGSSTVVLHRTLADWGEGVSDAPAQEGGGAPATPDDATWTQSLFGSANWATPGGDFVSSSSARKTVVGPGFYTWSSTPSLIAEVQSWLDQPATNFGWILIGTELFGSTTKRFDSRENPIADNRPTLTVEYVPEPSTLCLSAIAVCMCASIRGFTERRRYTHGS